jgi:hypothetical protein
MFLLFIGLIVLSALFAANEPKTTTTETTATTDTSQSSAKGDKIETKPIRRGTATEKEIHECYSSATGEPVDENRALILGKDGALKLRFAVCMSNKGYYKPDDCKSEYEDECWFKKAAEAPKPAEQAGDTVSKRVIVGGTGGYIGCSSRDTMGRLMTMQMAGTSHDELIAFLKSHARECTAMRSGEEMLVRKDDNGIFCVNHTVRSADPDPSVCYWAMSFFFQNEGR